MTKTPLQTPLHPWHVAHRRRMVDFAGWSMPVQYTSIVEEHLATPAVRVGLELAGKRVARQHAAVYRGSDLVGEVTSGTFSPTLDKPIAMAYVRPEAGSSGLELQVDIRGRRESAVVVKLPFYQRP